MINLINIRERKYEIGVLRTIGMKKINVVTQFMIELLIISFIGLIIGVGIGSTLAKPISNHLLASEIESSKKNQNDIQNNFGEGNKNIEKISGMVKIEAFDSINAVVDTKVIVELIGICLLLTIVSSIVASSSIVRFRPLSILKERS